VEIQKKGQRILKLIETIRRDCAKVVIAGMSSIGPTVAAVCSKGWCSDDSQQLREVAQLHGFAVRETAVNITGFKSTERSPKFVLVLGLPCAGKTTICRSVAESSDVDAVHFPAGKVIRDFINESPDSPESRELKQIVTTGEVEDRSGVATRRLLRSLVPAVMAKSANSELPVICLLDGFPRSEKQLTSFLDDLQFKLAALVVVSATDQVRRDRAQSRAARGVEEPPLDVRDGRDETEAMVAAAGMRAVAIHHVTNYEGMCEVIAGL
jgi:adenylate kinase family enzyme